MHIGLNAQLLNTAAGYRSAGVSTYSLQILRALGALAVEEVTPHRFTAWINDPNFHVDGIDLVVGNPGLARPAARIIWEQSAFSRALHSRRVDLVHGLVNVLPLTTTLPGVVTVHDLSFVRLPETLPRAKRLYLQRLCAASVARAARIIAVSRQTADDLITEFGATAARIDVIPNGVDPAFVPGSAEDIAAFRQEQGLPDRFILFVGTLEPRKNLALLLRGYARYRQAVPEPAPLIVAGGKGWFYDEVFRLVQELDLTESVRFPGFIAAGELPRWYQAAAVFVYPSRFEGFGLPVLEAMACATPVICSDAPSLLEVAGDAALIVDREEEPGHLQLADALETVLGDATLRDQLSRRGRARADGFSWDKTARATLDAYARAV